MVFLDSGEGVGPTFFLNNIETLKSITTLSTIVMGIFTKAFGGVESDERNNTLGGTNIAVGRAEFRGSVHSGGDVDVTIERQYGNRQSSAIDVAASVHGTGMEDVKVEKLLDQEKYPWSIPEESVNGGEPTHRRIDKDGSVHEYGDLDYHIDRLVIVPDVSGERSFRAEGDESTLRAFAQEGYDTAQELSVNGSVHDRGNSRSLLTTFS